MRHDKDVVRVWTDGSAHVNRGQKKKGAAAWSFVADFMDQRWDASGVFPQGDTADAELTAVTMALATIKVTHHPLILNIDCLFTIKCLTEIGPNSLRRGEWAGFKILSDYRQQTLRRAMELLSWHCRRRRIGIDHVKGHSGVFQNERADYLARTARRTGEGKPFGPVVRI